MSESLRLVPLAQLMPDPTQPRKRFIPERIEELSASLKSRGQLNPLRVLWSEERQLFLIVCGESRFRAAQLAKLEALECLVVEGTPSEADLLADRITENSVRSDLSSLDFARGIEKLKKLRSCSSSALAAELGLSNATITRAESLLTLPEPIQARIGNGLSDSSAYAISRLQTPEEQFELAERAIAGGWSRAVVEEEVQKSVPKKATPSKGSKLALKLAGGVAVNINAGHALKWPDVLALLERMLAEGKRLSDGGKPLGEWAKALKTS